MTDTQTAPAAAAPAAPALAAPRAKRDPNAPPKSITRTLTDSAKNQLVFNGVVRRDGTVGTYVTHRILKADGKVKESKRGETKDYASVAEARKAFDAGVAVAVKRGWQEKQPGLVGGYKAKPDSFTLETLPEPTKK